MYYHKKQHNKTNLIPVVFLALMLLGSTLAAQDMPGQAPQQGEMPQQEQMPPQEEMPGQDDMQQDQMQDYQMPQQQSVKENYSKKELEQFIDANEEATKVQQETQQEMVAVIEQEGMQVQEFNEIMTAQQNPEQKVDVPDEKMEKFNNAAEKVIEIQQNMETEVVGAIEKTGMDANKYSEIMLAYQSSPVVQEKVHQLLKEREGNK